MRLVIRDILVHTNCSSAQSCKSQRSDGHLALVTPRHKMISACDFTTTLQSWNIVILILLLVSRIRYGSSTWLNELLHMELYWIWGGVWIERLSYNSKGLLSACLEIYCPCNVSSLPLCQRLIFYRVLFKHFHTPRTR